MNVLHKLRPLLLEDTTYEERLPIMTPIELPERQSGGAMGGIQQPPAGNGLVPTACYETMEACPVSAAALQDHDGGYLGPAAISEAGFQPEDGQRPTSRPPEHSQTRRTPHDTLVLWCRGCVGGGRCMGRTECEQRLLLLLSLLLVLLLALLGVVILVTSGVWTFTGVTRSNTCSSAECAKAASNILASLNEEVSPCENFAEFVCGGWRRKHSIPEGKFRWGVFDILREHTLLDLRELLEEEGKAEEPFPIRAARTIYRACVNDSAWQEVGLRPLLRLLEEEGGLPMLDPYWSGLDFQAMRSLARLRRAFGSQFLVALTVEPDSRNTSVFVIYVSEGSLPLRRKYLTPASSATKHHREIQTSYMRRTGQRLLKEDRKHKNQTYLDTLDRDIVDLWDFYVKVAEITAPETSDPWQTYNPMTLEEFQALTDAANSSFKVDWLGYLLEIFHGINVTISGEERIIVDWPQYFQQLVLLLQDTPPRTLANYLLFPLVTEMGEETSTRLLTHQRRLLRPSASHTWSLGRAKSRPWEDCTQKTNALLPLALGSLYVRHHHQPSLVSAAREVVEDMSAAFKDMLASASWMDGSTQQEALKKLDEMLHLVAFPELVQRDDLMEDYHRELPNVSSVDHMANVVALKAWHSRSSLLHLRLSASRQRWPRGPLEINAFHSPFQNAIVIPVAVLQPPFLYHQELTALNYGALGSIIGHEITHGFDNNGRQRDWAGNLNHWWTSETLAQYMNRTQCFAQQYSAYNVTSLLQPQDREGKDWKIDGNRTLGENIADNGAIRAAWAAWRAQGGVGGTSLPGLQHYTQDQLFFIGYGKVWCTRDSPYAIKLLLGIDPHSPAHYRILGPLRNSPEFSQAFSCSLQDPMNPSNKCQLF